MLPNKDIMLQAIAERVHKRQEKWKTKIVTHFPALPEIEEKAILGTFSYCLQESKTRLLNSTTLLKVNGTSDTISSVCRDYLIIKHRRPPKIKSEQAKEVMQVPPPPIFVQPAGYSHGYYLDLKNAYWQVLKVTGWNVDYWPNKWLGKTSSVEDFPFQGDTHNEKMARRLLVTTGIMSKMTYWIPEKQITREVKHANSLINWQIWRLVRDILQCVAQDAVKAGAIYANTDGYIAPNHKTKLSILQALADWGLDSALKAEGRGQVSGAGDYRVGIKRTGIMRRKRISSNNLVKVEYHKWLKSEFTKMMLAAQTWDATHNLVG